MPDTEETRRRCCERRAFRQLSDSHHALDDRLKVLVTKPHLTDDEQFQEVTLKKENCGSRIRWRRSSDATNPAAELDVRLTFPDVTGAGVSTGAVAACRGSRADGTNTLVLTMGSTAPGGRSSSAPGRGRWPAPGSADGGGRCPSCCSR